MQNQWLILRAFPVAVAPLRWRGELGSSHRFQAMSQAAPRAFLSSSPYTTLPHITPTVHSRCNEHLQTILTTISINPVQGSLGQTLHMQVLQVIWNTNGPQIQRNEQEDPCVHLGT